MAKSLLSNAQDFRFKDFDLTGSLLSWEDDLPQRLAKYEYLKRPGGETEPMAPGIKAWVFHCVFMGADCGARYKALAASVDADPRGPMVHPRLGKFDAACDGIKSREDPEHALDVIEFTIALHENQVDQLVRSDAQFGPQVRGSQVSEALAAAADAVNSIVANRIANLVYSACVAALADFATWANKFTSTALEAAQSNTPDPSMTTLLGRVLSKRDAALAALAATLTRTLEPDVTLTEARTNMYLAYAACVQLNAAVRDQLPPIVPFVVPTAMTRNQILVRLYGPDARAQGDTFDRLNRLPTPHWVPAGTELRVLAPLLA